MASRGFTVWLTGLSGAGKTTISLLLEEEIRRRGLRVVRAFISPYREARERARHEIEAEGGFVEVYVRCPLEECVRRDPKGLYARALRGEIPAFTGVSDPYEEPEKPDIVVDTHLESPPESAARVITELEARGLLRRGPVGSTV